VVVFSETYLIYRRFSKLFGKVFDLSLIPIERYLFLVFALIFVKINWAAERGYFADYA
jgi:hypothetical protein